jgi:hypothetical protein
MMEKILCFEYDVIFFFFLITKDPFSSSSSSKLKGTNLARGLEGEGEGEEEGVTFFCCEEWLLLTAEERGLSSLSSV